MNEAIPSGARGGGKLAAANARVNRSVAAEWTFRHLLQFAFVAFQFGLLIILIRAFGIESKAYLQLMVYAFCGFVLNHFLPPRFRLRFFVALSLAGFVLVFGALNAVRLFGAALALLAVAHAPAAWAVRVALVCAGGAALAWLRVTPDISPVPSALWPILGSMFMFRLMIYLYDMKHRKTPSDPAQVLAYFFMLPNACFPMFPLVDYKTFGESHYNDDPILIYQKGLHWCFHGLVHILLYRVIYQNVVVDPGTIVDAEGAVRHIASSYLVYLKFTGAFHLIIGSLHLFGFNLPRVFHYWMLVAGFTDLWRRVNIYWKNFIQKHFFYPAFFFFGRRLSGIPQLAATTGVAFSVTWLLHSWQWFWIRGQFPVLWQDLVFWVFIGGGVFTNMVLETKFGRKRMLSHHAIPLSMKLVKAAKTVAMFVLMCFAWTFWTADSGEEISNVLAGLANMTPLAAAWIVGGLGMLVVASLVLSHRTAEDSTPSTRAPQGGPTWQVLARGSAPAFALAAVMFVIAYQPLVFSFNSQLLRIVDNVRSGEQLSARDSKAMERGYYEDLTNVNRFNDELAGILQDMPPRWNENAAVRRVPGSFPPYEFTPSVSIPYKGAMLKTNAWGMHDREYSREKPPGTYRVAVLGSSHTVGIGVDRSETFENLVEDRLNRELSPRTGLHYEILNFAVSGYGPICSLATVEQKVLGFGVDAVLDVGMDDITWVVNELVNAAEKSIPVLYEDLVRMEAEVDVRPGTPRLVAERNLTPHARELLRWVYAREVAMLRERGIVPLGTVLPRPEDLTQRIKDLDAEQTAMMHEAGFEMIDTYGAYHGVTQYESLWIRPYDRHPNQRGHQMLADAVYAAISGPLTAAAAR